MNNMLKFAQIDTSEVQVFTRDQAGNVVEYDPSAIGQGVSASTILIVQILNVVLTLIALGALITLMCTWIMMLVQVIKREDLKESKLLWAMLLLFAGPIGMIAYPFVENRKKLGVITIIAFVTLPLVLSGFAIFRFMIMAAV